MRRSGHLNGATVALELLPRDIDAAENAGLVAEICAPHPEADPDRAAGLRIADCSLRGHDSTISLASVASLAKMPSSPPDCAKPQADDVAPGDLGAALGCLLCEVVEKGGADQRALYRISVVLAMLTKSREALAILSLIEKSAVEHPAISALRGYLALQNGEVETGRRFLAKAALSARGVPSSRSVLHFTQHVLLVHQFNG